MSKRTFFLAFVLAGAAQAANGANPAGFGPAAAAASVKGFKVPEGLKVSLFASEPLVRNPTDMDIDERGRVWITEGGNYRSSFKPWGTLQPEGDRIVVLEDTNGDGRADKETVFYQDPSINAALGICVLGNKVIVSDSPNVFVLTDLDGDGKADKRELLFTGIGGFDHDHGVHAFTFGPDGKLYFNMGNEAKQLRRPLNKEVPLHGMITNVASKPVIDLDGNEVSNHGKPYQMGMVFRCDLDGSEVETLAWNFRNNYEVAVDSFGTMWQSDNDDDGNQGVRINYVMDYGNYGYHDEITGATWREGWEKARLRGAPEDAKVFYEWHQFDPGVVPNLLHTGAGSPTGIAVYEGELLPEIFRNQVIHCDAGPRVVRAYPVHRTGAGYKAATENILTTEDTWFRPADVCVAPDGSIFVVDWNDAAVGGHNMADQKAAEMTGRVYRIAPMDEGAHPDGSRSDRSERRARAPSLDFGTAAGCAAALQSPNLSTRYLAWIKLHEMQGQAANSLRRIWKSDDARMRARALQLLARIKGSEKRYVQEAIRDGDEDIRIAGLRIARELKFDLIPLVEKLATDKSPAVRRECAICLRHNLSPRAPKLWADLAAQHDGKDRWYLEALGIGADRQWDKFLDAWQQKLGDRWDTAAGRDIVWRSRSQATPALLARIITEDRLKESEQARYFRSFDFLIGREKNVALLQLLKGTELSSGTIAVEVLTRLQGMDAETNPEIGAGLQKALQQMRGTRQFVEIVRDFKIQDQDEGLVDFALREPASSTAAEALRLILKHGKAELLKAGLAGTNAARLVLPLGNTAEKDTVPLLEPIVMDPSRDLSLRKQGVHALAQTQSGAAALLKSAREQALPEDLKFTVAAELNNVRWAKIKAEAAELVPLPKSADAQPLPPIADLAKLKGDAGKGAAVFRRDPVGCIKCHQVNGEGLDFGPSLSDIGAKLGKDALYEAILDPSAGISFGYEAWRVTLKNGDDANGLIVNDTADEIALKTVEGIVTRYKKSDIASRAQQKLSIMPAGLQQTMSPQDLVDLVEYLATLKTSKTAASR
jgi:putative membrane-bound dehydrogenase-like protein